MTQKIQSIAFLGNYLPRKCGIATFTTDLCTSFVSVFPKIKIFAIAMTNKPEEYEYPPMVKFEIRDRYIPDYDHAADFINSSDLDILCIQHEYGIFGGEWGRYLITLLKKIKIPIVTTLHTVLDEDMGQKKVFDELMSISSKIVVLSKTAVDMLVNDDVPREKIAFIHHGIPDIPFVDPNFYKDTFKVMGKKVILTFGLIGPDKGIEYMIDAMPIIKEKHPDIVYMILGATHPEIIKHCGEEYRLSLRRKVEELKLTDMVQFHNRFVEIEELCTYLSVADIYVTPYLKEKQISSGTLAYAMGMGKAVISTPYWYAKELLSDNRGIIVDFKDSQALAQNVIDLLDNDVKLHRMRKKAFQFGRDMVWHNVALKYMSLFNQAVAQYNPKKTFSAEQKLLSPANVPAINLNHLNSLTTDFGILQHAKFTIPDFKHGYCLDDNARALIVATKYYKVFNDPDILPYLKKYMAFVMYSQRDDGTFINFFNMDLNPVDKDEVVSDDCFGRAIWGLGYCIAYAPDYYWMIGKTCFDNAIKYADNLNLRGSAYALLGLHYYLKRYCGSTWEKTLIQKLVKKIIGLYKTNVTQNWQWFESKLTYSNGVIPTALWIAYNHLQDQQVYDTAKSTTDFLWNICIRNNILSLVGSNGWMTKGSDEKCHFDQQPIDAAWMVTLAQAAYRCTNDTIYLDYMKKAFAWYLGRNDLNLPLYDYITGGCYDGLMSAGVNRNQGAESTIMFLLSLMAYNETVVEEDGLGISTVSPLQKI
ncbi:glycosyltransferase [bacterium]|nr:glycosyltransferase [bacterium]